MRCIRLFQALPALLLAQHLALVQAGAETAAQSGFPAEAQSAGERAAEGAPIVTRVYQVQYIDVLEAYALARSQCPPAVQAARCVGKIQKSSFFEFDTDSQTHSRIVEVLSQND